MGTELTEGVVEHYHRPVSHRARGWLNTSQIIQVFLHIVFLGVARAKRHIQNTKYIQNSILKEAQCFPAPTKKK